MFELTTLNVYTAADNGLLRLSPNRLTNRMLAFFALGLGIVSRAWYVNPFRWIILALMIGANRNLKSSGEIRLDKSRAGGEARRVTSEWRLVVESKELKASEEGTSNANKRAARVEQMDMSGRYGHTL